MGNFADMMMELSRREKELNIMPDPDVDIYMKVRESSYKNTIWINCSNFIPNTIMFIFKQFLTKTLHIKSLLLKLLLKKHIQTNPRCFCFWKKYVLFETSKYFLMIFLLFASNSFLFFQKCFLHGRSKH